MFVPDFQILQGVLPVEPLNTTHDAQTQFLQQHAAQMALLGDGSAPTSSPRIVIMIAPNDGPYPPDPR